MKILEEVKAIIGKYNLKPIELPDGIKNVYELLRLNPDVSIYNKSDEYLYVKYKSNIPRGWYGVDIGNPIIPEWLDIIDEILELCVEKDPNLEIHQIKLKLGSIRFYVESETIEDIHEVMVLIINKLYDRALIY